MTQLTNDILELYAGERTIQTIKNYATYVCHIEERVFNQQSKAEMIHWFCKKTGVDFLTTCTNPMQLESEIISYIRSNP